MRWSPTVLIGAALLLGGSATRADDIRGAETILCTAAQSTQCFAEGDCLSKPPWELNIPQFIKVDLERRELRSTEASGENRSTPVKNLEREEGLLFLQGVERGRAFSFVIAEDDGFASIAVARDGVTVTVFGACTPMPSEE